MMKWSLAKKLSEKYEVDDRMIHGKDIEWRLDDEMIDPWQPGKLVVCG